MGKDIFKATPDLIDAMGLNNKLCGVATDGAPAMAGVRKGSLHGLRQSA